MTNDDFEKELTGISKERDALNQQRIVLADEIAKREAILKNIDNGLFVLQGAEAALNRLLKKAAEELSPPDANATGALNQM